MTDLELLLEFLRRANIREHHSSGRLPDDHYRISPTNESGACCVSVLSQEHGFGRDDRCEVEFYFRAGGICTGIGTLLVKAPAKAEGRLR